MATLLQALSKAASCGGPDAGDMRPCDAEISGGSAASADTASTPSRLVGGIVLKMRGWAGWSNQREAC